jgi:hypothetical protein
VWPRMVFSGTHGWVRRALFWARCERITSGVRYPKEGNSQVDPRRDVSVGQHGTRIRPAGGCYGSGGVAA